MFEVFCLKSDPNNQWAVKIVPSFLNFHYILTHSLTFWPLFQDWGLLEWSPNWIWWMRAQMPEMYWRTSCCRYGEVCIIQWAVQGYKTARFSSLSSSYNLSQYPINLPLFYPHSPPLFAFLCILIIHYFSQFMSLFIHFQAILEWWIAVRRTLMERKTSRQPWRLRGNSSCPTQLTGTWLIKWAPHACRKYSTRWP